MVEEALERNMEAGTTQTTTSDKTYDFAIIITDKYVYHFYSDFRSQHALTHSAIFQQMERDHRQQAEVSKHASCIAAALWRHEQQQKGPAILDLEKTRSPMKKELR